ncbi:MAG: hypothetical protein KJO55_03360 [Gammaproteobacteria bacterium]|nr:hypothetical protein [Gammaproteobacteria bacterium]NND59962.1 hypothetical protein [Gammaproteobacteria bacterium]
MFQHRTIAALLLLSAFCSNLQAEQIIITDLSDFEFGAVAPSAGMLVLKKDICVALDSPARYSVLARGTGPADQFTLSNGFNQLSYTVYFSDRPNQAGAQLSAGIPQPNLRGKKWKRGQVCRRATASIEVRVAASELAAAGAGQYSGLLILTVTAD